MRDGTVLALGATGLLAAIAAATSRPRGSSARWPGERDGEGNITIPAGTRLWHGTAAPKAFELRGAGTPRAPAFFTANRAFAERYGQGPYGRLLEYVVSHPIERVFATSRPRALFERFDLDEERDSYIAIARAMCRLWEEDPTYFPAGYWLDRSRHADSEMDESEIVLCDMSGLRFMGRV